MKLFKKIKARHISNYIIKQIQKLSESNIHDDYLRVTKTTDKMKYIYIKFHIIDGVKDVKMNFIEYYKSQHTVDKRWLFPRKSIFYYWKKYKERLPKKLYKYLDLLSKRYNYSESDKVRNLALMVFDNISNSKYELPDGSFVHNTGINSMTLCYKISLSVD